MTTLSNNDIARAIYLVSRDKTGRELKEVYTNVVRFLFRRRLLSKSRDILERLDKIINNEKGRIVAKITTARKLRGESKREILHFLRKRYRAKEAVLAEMLDEKLLGGVKIEVGDEIIDLTVKNKIKKLQEHLTRKI